MIDDPEVGWRIGELSRRVGVSTDVLRAWERRYGVLNPRRSPAGQRLYTREDEQRIRDMRSSMDQGYSAAVAARLALADSAVAARAEAAAATASAGPVPASAGATTPARRFVSDSYAGPVPDAGLGRSTREELADTREELADGLRTALDAFDDGSANTSLDRLLAVHGLEVTICDVVLPLLNDIGVRWARNEVTVAQEHFASALLMGRLRALSRGWDEGTGPRALVACPSGEAHDLGLLCFSLLLRRRGCRIIYLGASVPGDSLFRAAESVAPDMIVVAAVREEPFWDAYEALSELSDLYPMAIGGAGATPAMGEHLRARVLPGDPREAVAAVSQVSLG